jgi:ATP-dependent helicase/nuclease subunit A
MTLKRKFAPAPDQEQRDLILTELDSNLLVEAAAGTGKTTSMVARMIALIATGKCADVNKLVAVTFTRKAAAELRSRFQVKLEESVRETGGEEKKRLAAALERVEQCYVGTIHSFCARLLRERPVEAGVDLSFEAIEEDADSRLRKEAWSEYSAELYLHDSSGIIEELSRLGLSLGDLEKSFDRFADFPDVDEWPVSHADNRVFDEIKELRPRVEQCVAHMRELVPKFPDETGNDKLMDTYKKIVRMAPHFDLSEPAHFMSLLEVFDAGPNLVQSQWAKTGVFKKQDAKDEKTRWDSFREDVVRPLVKLWCERRYEPVIRVMTGAKKTYDRLRHSKGALNYQDLLSKARALLKDKPHVRKYFSSRYTHLLVDEFHDTDPIQAEMMMLLTALDPYQTNWRACVPRPGSLFVVGDPKQSIYRFRRADIVVYNEVKEIFKRNGKIVLLSANFRSAPQIVDWVNSVFGPAEDAQDRMGVEMLRFADSDSEESPAYVQMKVGREKVKGPFVGLRRLDVEYAKKQTEAVSFEADFIARTIRDAVDRGMPIPRSRDELAKGKSEAACPGDFMIVTYNTKHLSRYGQALQSYGIPHQVTGGAALNEVEELKLFHRCLKAVTEPDNSVSLVAALRSALFGVSDASLYAFKKAGGYFSYRARVPDDLPQEHAGPVREAFERLQLYGGWLSKLPYVSAFERVLGDLGLMVQASLRPGGDVEAGSLAKAIEIVRGAQKDIWSVKQLVDHLGDLVQATEKYDGVSARPDNRQVVRVMNLHKVKGLEANVVFLACPFGDNDFPPDIHVDRSGDKVVGYLPIPKKIGEHQNKTVALPPNWDVLQAREAEFDRAEKLRLRYVAATRAGCVLVVTNYEGKNQKNPWGRFLEHLPDSCGLEDPGLKTAPERKKISITRKDVKESTEAMFKRLTNAAQATYHAEGAKAYALAGPETKALPVAKTTGSDDPEGVHGVEWGSAIHRLLETVMRDPNVEILTLARVLLAEYELDETLADTAQTMVESVIKSDIWKRANKSERSFTEIPFQVLLDSEDGARLPTVIRGSIDLVFKEPDGWILVDYKTDSLKGTSTDQLAQKYAPQVRLYAKAWEKCTGEKVKAMGFLFPRAGEMVEVVG